MDNVEVRPQRGWRDAITLAAIMLAVFAASSFLRGQSYLLFHSFIELFTAAVALMVFSIAWHTRRIRTSDYVTFVGMASLPIAVITIFHALSYKGFPIFIGHDTNLPTTLWIIARTLQASAFMLAPVFLIRQLRNAGAALGIYTILGVVLVVLAFENALPPTFIEGTGLTPFKIWMEYAVIAATALGAVLLFVFREHMQGKIRALLFASMTATIFAELAFTLYTDDVTGVFSRLGHVAHLTAFLLIYIALVSTSLEEPLTALFLRLKKQQDELASAYDTEHDIAETLQSAMAVDPEHAPGIELSHRYLPAPGVGRIGGDFYDVFSLRDGLMAFAMGDVCGKGLHAATDTVKARSAIRALALQQKNPDAVLEAANTYLHRELDEDSFVTAVFGTINTHDGEVNLAVAGHPDPIICGRLGQTAPPEARSQPLGVLPKLDIGVWNFTMSPGESLVLVTDGIIEAPGRDDRFGTERLEGVLHHLDCESSPADIVDSVIEELHAHTGEALDDDVAVVAIRFNPGKSSSAV